jgi:hypothetical protein
VSRWPESRNVNDIPNVYTLPLVSKRNKDLLSSKISIDEYFDQSRRAAETTARREVLTHMHTKAGLRWSAITVSVFLLGVGASVLLSTPLSPVFVVGVLNLILMALLLLTALKPR